MFSTVITSWAKEHEVPSYVANISVEDLTTFQPTHKTAGNVWLHALDEYYKPKELRKQADLNKIDEDARFFQISSDINIIKQACSAIDNELDDPSNYAVFEKQGDVVIKKYPIRNRTEWTKAAEYLQKNEMTLPTDLKRKIATKLLQKAGAYDMGGNLTEYLTKRAGQGIPVFTTISEELTKRAELYGVRDLKVLAESVKSMTIQDNTFEVLDKIAELICEYDLNNNEERDYRNLGIDAPDEFIYSLTAKTASDLVSSTCTLKNGNMYTHDQLESIPYEKLAAVFGDDVAQGAIDGINISGIKVAEIAETLPLPQAEMFADILDNLGEKPVTKEASYKEDFWTDEFLRSVN